MKLNISKVLSSLQCRKYFPHMFLSQFLSNYWSNSQGYLAHAYILAWPLDSSHIFHSPLGMYIVLLVSIIIMNLSQNVPLDHF